MQTSTVVEDGLSLDEDAEVCINPPPVRFHFMLRIDRKNRRGKLGYSYFTMPK